MSLTIDEYKGYTISLGNNHITGKQYICCYGGDGFEKECSTYLQLKKCIDKHLQQKIKIDPHFKVIKKPNHFEEGIILNVVDISNSGCFITDKDEWLVDDDEKSYVVYDSKIHAPIFKEIKNIKNEISLLYDKLKLIGDNFIGVSLKEKKASIKNKQIVI